MYEVKVIKRFRDIEKDKELREVGTTFTIKTDERLKALMGGNKQGIKFVELVKAHKKYPESKGPKMVIYQNYICNIGGIETFLYNFTKHYKDRNITIMADTIETVEQICLLSKYANIEQDHKQKIKCDVLLLGNYNCDAVIPRTKCKKIYQMIHADWEELRKVPIWNTFKWKPSKKVDEIIAVSDTAATGLKNSMKVDSKVIYNILEDDFEEEDGLTFITLSRMTPEKGARRIVEMAKAFKAAGKKFTWLLCCNMNQVTDQNLKKEILTIPEFVIIPPSVDNRRYIKYCDYLVQLSETESFCYSAFEALQRGKPVILTDFREAKNIIKNGKNGYIVKKDLSNLDVDKIFNNVPKEISYVDRCNYDLWEEVFEGKL